MQALLSWQGPCVTLDIPWVALIDQSISIVVAHSSSIRVKDSLKTTWRTKMDNILKTILNGESLSKLGEDNSCWKFLNRVCKLESLNNIFQLSFLSMYVLS
jgi:hypothetical protein